MEIQSMGAGPVGIAHVAPIPVVIQGIVGKTGRSGQDAPVDADEVGSRQS